ncbi:hypothetical protein L873DRAFT_1821701, partial [Choiromyces venosus 120613-1]
MGNTDLQVHRDNDKDEQSSVSYTADDGRKTNPGSISRHFELSNVVKLFMRECLRGWRNGRVL